MKIFRKVSLLTTILFMFFIGSLSMNAKAEESAAMDVKAISGYSIGNSIVDSVDGDMWYKFTTSEKSSYVQVSLSPEKTGSAWWIEVYDSKFKLLFKKPRIGINGTHYISYPMSVGSNTTFYVKIFNYFNAPGVQYTLLVNEVYDPNWEIEPNSKMSTATTLEKGKKMYGSMWMFDDVDYYKYTMTKDGMVNFDFKIASIPEGEYSWFITLLDEKGNQITSFRSGIKGASSGFYRFKKGTIIYIKITDQSLGVGLKYSLCAKEKKLDKEPYELEANNDEKSADTLKSSVKGSLYCEKDVDYYCYEATGKKKVTVKFYVLDKKKIKKGWTAKVYEEKVGKNSCLLSVNLKTAKKLSFKTEKGKKYYIVLKSAGAKNKHDVVGVGYKLQISK